MKGVGDLITAWRRVPSQEGPPSWDWSRKAERRACCVYTTNVVGLIVMVGRPAWNLYLSSRADRVLSLGIPRSVTANDERTTATNHSSLFLNIPTIFSKESRWWTQRKICTHLHWSVKLWYLNCTELSEVRTDGVLCSPNPLWTQSREVMTFSQPVILFLAIWSPILHRFAFWVCVNAYRLSSLGTVFQLCLLCCYQVSGWVVSYSPLDSVYQVFLSGLPLLSFMLYFIHLKLQLLTTKTK